MESGDFLENILKKLKKGRPPWFLCAWFRDSEVVVHIDNIEHVSMHFTTPIIWNMIYVLADVFTLAKKYDLSLYGVDYSEGEQGFAFGIRFYSIDKDPLGERKPLLKPEASKFERVHIHFYENNRIALNYVPFENAQQSKDCCKCQSKLKHVSLPCSWLNYTHRMRNYLGHVKYMGLTTVSEVEIVHLKENAYLKVVMTAPKA